MIMIFDLMDSDEQNARSPPGRYVFRKLAATDNSSHLPENIEVI
jgi:hypothetical protein